MKTSIFPTLEKLGLTSKSTRVLFNDRTRDIAGLSVWKDTGSGIIYIDDFYTGNETYVAGSYRDEKISNLKTGQPHFERNNDAFRRKKENLRFVTGKKLLDFGCGSGDFLNLVRPYCTDVVGVELQQSYIDELIKKGIKCVNNLDKIQKKSIDMVVSFHVIEHLPNPLETLAELSSKVKSGGLILIEVPHANDFLLSTVASEEFKQFTLWSQHLILHTRRSLEKILEFVGLEDIQIKGVQRYPLSNHINWLAHGKPGGHKTALSFLDSDLLFNQYQNALASIDATDTLVALAKVP